MKKITASVLIVSTLALSTFSSCKKAETLKEPTANNNTVEPSQPQVFWYVVVVAAAVVAAIGKLSSGQATNVVINRTTNPDGSVTESASYNCAGVGSCHVALSAPSTGNSFSDSSIPADSHDYEVKMKVVKNNDGKILLGLDPSENSTQDVDKLFYDDEIDFLSPGQVYTIDNVDVLTSLGLTDPIVVNAGKYKVYNGSDGGIYIIIDQI